MTTENLTKKYLNDTIATTLNLLTHLYKNERNMAIDKISSLSNISPIEKTNLLIGYCESITNRFYLTLQNHNLDILLNFCHTELKNKEGMGSILLKNFRKHTLQECRKMEESLIALIDEKIEEIMKKE